MLQDQLKRIDGKTGSWGQSFNFTTPRAGTAGSSAAVPVERTLEALDVMQAALKKVGKAPVAFACRYGTRSPGLLAFLRFPRTTIIDIDGLDSPATRAVMREAIAGANSPPNTAIMTSQTMTTGRMGQVAIAKPQPDKRNAPRMTASRFAWVRSMKAPTAGCAATPMRPLTIKAPPTAN